LIVIVAIGTRFTAKNMISYPKEFIGEEIVQDFATPKEQKVISPFCSFFSSIIPKSL
tara:strand:- start:17 stop:187 length:171 start_codon:yes stop_codon:yes gene_type:complete